MDQKLIDFSENSVNISLEKVFISMKLKENLENLFFQKLIELSKNHWIIPETSTPTVYL